MKAELITMKADKSVVLQSAEGTELRLTVKGTGADAVIFDIKEEANTLHVHARGTGFARLTEETEQGVVDLTDVEVGQWKQGVPSDSIITNQPTHVPDQTELEAYGGYVVCESVDPQFRSLIIAAPDLQKGAIALEKYVDHFCECEECVEGCGDCEVGAELRSEAVRLNALALRKSRGKAVPEPAEQAKQLTIVELPVKAGVTP